MTDYNLDIDEAVILQNNNVACITNSLPVFKDELVLTNKNIIYVCIGVFGRVKEIKKYPLEQIKMYNNKPQVLILKAKDGNKEMQIFTVNQQMSFRFRDSEKKQMPIWIDKITQLMVKGETTINNKGTKTLPGIKNIVETIKETKYSLKDVMFTKAAKKIYITCPKCGAQIEGVKKQVAVCEYCGNRMTL